MSEADELKSELYNKLSELIDDEDKVGFDEMINAVWPYLDRFYDLGLTSTEQIEVFGIDMPTDDPIWQGVKYAVSHKCNHCGWGWGIIRHKFCPGCGNKIRYKSE